MSKERLIVMTIGMYLSFGVALSLFGPTILAPSPFDDLDWPPRRAPELPSLGGLLIGLVPAVAIGIIGFLQIYPKKEAAKPGDDRATWVALWLNAIGAFGLCLKVIDSNFVIVGLLLAPLGLAVSSFNLVSRLVGHLIHSRS